ncbi:hypothetical protein CSA_023379 [Cucumis sativus]|uniref:Uncharacterized protein n=1 Tax=Cucumis sativus TaxID=3659 RepID=A0ACB6HBU8_CUCSA|nr:hypothetical protein CSA_023379 [Cucumis sativus]
MDEALEHLRNGEWLHTFPEGKVTQDDVPIRRLKWGTASLIVRSPITPIVLPIVHRGFDEIMPENSLFGRRPPVPLCCKKIEIIVGEPIQFDIPSMKQMAISMSRNWASPLLGWPATENKLGWMSLHRDSCTVISQIKFEVLWRNYVHCHYRREAEDLFLAVHIFTISPLYFLD